MKPSAIFTILISAITHPSSAAQASPPTAASVTAQIDDHFAKVWREAGVRPARPATAAEYLRRVSLDIVGHVPSVPLVREFLEDSAADQRASVVAKFVHSAEYGRHAAALWRRDWIPQSDAAEFSRLTPEFERWMGKELNAGAAYDRLVFEAITAADFSESQRAWREPRQAAPTSFLAASDGLPENLAANSMRAFAGISLECAECHDHPFADWNREQFWQVAAFFSRMPPAAQRSDGDSPLAIAIPGASQVVAPAFLNGAPVVWPEEMALNTGRRVFAEWLIDHDNPYFARNTVNQVWLHFFGARLVNPQEGAPNAELPGVDHQPLLDALARDFSSSGYDLKLLTEAIVLSKPYQLSSAGDATAGNSEEVRHFSRMLVRSLTGEQLYDSLMIAGGLTLEEDSPTSPAVSPRRKFATLFPANQSAVERRSVLQTLTMMNGEPIAELTRPDAGPMLAAVANSPFLDGRARIESLYLAVVGRKPSEEELLPLAKHFGDSDTPEGRRNALSDIFWALLNSSEFSTNH